jgi:fibronectin type 3 domain-containing protein
VTLRWTPPAGGEPAAFYRIYRGSTEYASRYGLTARSTELEFTDTNATEPHKYWVTTVDSNMTESSPIGPVEK